MIPPINSTNFKGKYLVQVPKTAFDDPKKAQKCEDDFESEFAKVLYQDTTRAQRKKMTFMSFLEAPIYSDVVDGSNYPLTWVRAHTGIDVKDPVNPDYHSFVVITKGEADEMLKRTSRFRMRPIEKQIDRETEEREDKGLCTDQVWVNARAYVAFNEILQGCTKNSGVNETIILNSLEDIPYAIGEMDFKN